jgi:predicted enzyme related to lactoylglutathione lyase
MKVITQLAMIPVLVNDQDEALHFYTEKLGLEKRSDIQFGPGMRWLTVAPKGQKRPEIALAKPDARLHGEERIRELIGRIGQGTLWVFGTDNCHKAYEMLHARGVKFLSTPTKQLYGVEAIFEDPYGNKFSLLEPSAESRTGEGGHAMGTAA